MLVGNEMGALHLVNGAVAGGGGRVVFLDLFQEDNGAHQCNDLDTERRGEIKQGRMKQ